MASSVARALCVVALAAAAGCSREEPRPAALPETVPAVTNGTLEIAGLTAPVTVVRDRWGVPHITAANQDDLFVAQGFVQAEDRLFQMDLWRRSVQGRLAEVLGANFIERDAMTRRIQYRGAIEEEWDAYGPDAKSIAAAFTRGINAWVTRARDHLPREFALAGWKPDLWAAEDLLNRTDSFLAARDAQDEVLRARLVAAMGAARADALWPPPNGRTPISLAVDPATIPYTLGDLLRRVGTQPFFLGLAANPGAQSDAHPEAAFPSDIAGPGSDRSNAPYGSNAWGLPSSRSGHGAPLLAGDFDRRFASPSLRYLVHLRAPGWNVAGTTAPWHPGVSAGHNEQVAWTMTASSADTEDIFVEKLNPANDRQVLAGGRWVDMDVLHDTVPVKGRSEPYEYDRLYTPHGVVVGIDRDRHLAFALAWSGMAPGGAGELGALAIDRASSSSTLRAALDRWQSPAAEFVFADRDGRVGRQLAGAVPRRQPEAGRLPAAGWVARSGWNGWLGAGGMSHADARDGIVVSANDSVARTARIREVLAAGGAVDLDAMGRLQHDVLAWNAEQLIPHLEGLHASDASVERARQSLVSWDRRLTIDSPVAGLYTAWEAMLRQLLVEHRLPPDLRNDIGARLPSIVPLLEEPTRTWFDGDVRTARDALLLDALARVVMARSEQDERRTWGARHTVTFTHPLAITDRTKQRYNVGPFPVPGYQETVFAATPETGPATMLVFDLANWDDGRAMNAPGQSESPASPHFSDLAKLWAAGDYIPLVFSDSAIRANAESTLTLVPAR
jgi:penicillin amidase